MPNPHGEPIWYELMTPDPKGSVAFYEPVVGWTVDAPLPGPVEYRIVQAPGAQLGGMLQMTPDMLEMGAKPAWLVYIGVDDVDTTAAKAKELGGQVLVPPMDIPNVGRFSLLVDPQGAVFYIMRGSTDAVSTVFAPGEPGRCAWNELITTDVEAALAFYGPVFGWENRETMPMGPAGGYHFLDLGGKRLGALMADKSQPAHWNLYFTVADIDAAVKTTSDKGGRIVLGPQVVPTGERVILGLDPQGAGFALVGPG